GTSRPPRLPPRTPSRSLQRPSALQAAACPRPRDAPERARKPRAEVEHTHPGRPEVDPGHPRARLVDTGEVLSSRFFTEVASGRGRVFGRDPLELADLNPPADREHLGRERLCVDRDRYLGVRA